MRNSEFRPPTHICPQMTQITQIKIRSFTDVICVDLRDRRGGKSIPSKGRSFTSEWTHHLVASSIQRYEMLC